MPTAPAQAYHHACPTCAWKPLNPNPPITCFDERRNKHQLALRLLAVADHDGGHRVGHLPVQHVPPLLQAAEWGRGARGVGACARACVRAARSAGSSKPAVEAEGRCWHHRPAPGVHALAVRQQPQLGSAVCVAVVWCGGLCGVESAHAPAERRPHPAECSVFSCLATSGLRCISRSGAARRLRISGQPKVKCPTSRKDVHDRDGPHVLGQRALPAQKTEAIQACSWGTGTRPLVHSTPRPPKQKGHACAGII